MKKVKCMRTLVLGAIALIICTGCNKETPENVIGIKDISFENYPKVDGSTSSSVLNMTFASKLLGVPYHWVEPGIVTEWTLQPVYAEIPEQYKDFFWQHIKSSKTHGAFINLIDGEADLILTHRTISSDEQAHADSVGITLTETPIAHDAFVFIVNKSNPVRSLTVSQIQKIYTGEITNWSQVGGEILHNENAICYTFNTYKNLQARIPDSEVPKIAINGIFPDTKTVKNGTYPFTSKVHVAIRSDLDHQSMAYKLYEWVQSEDAKSIIKECGFLVR